MLLNLLVKSERSEAASIKAKTKQRPDWVTTTKRLSIMDQIRKVVVSKIDSEKAKERRDAKFVTGKYKQYKKTETIERVLQERLEELDVSITWRVLEAAQSETFAGKPLIGLRGKFKKSVDSGKKTYNQAYRDWINSLKAKPKETPLKRVARIKQERNIDDDFEAISQLTTGITTKGVQWRDFNEVKWFIKDLGKDLKSSPAIVGINLPNVYNDLKKRYYELQTLREERGDVRAESFEGAEIPEQWQRGDYWHFVKSSDEVSTESIEDKKGKIRHPATKQFIKAAPRQRWKNAYGVIIDGMQITYRPSGATEDVTELLYVVTDPFASGADSALPHHFKTWAEANKAFGKTYPEKLGYDPITSPEEMGRNPIFPLRNLKKILSGTHKGIDKNSAPQTTEGVMNQLNVEYVGTPPLERLPSGEVIPWEHGGGFFQVTVTNISADATSHEVVVEDQGEDQGELSEREEFSILMAGQKEGLLGARRREIRDLEIQKELRFAEATLSKEIRLSRSKNKKAILTALRKNIKTLKGGEFVSTQETLIGLGFKPEYFKTPKPGKKGVEFKDRMFSLKGIFTEGSFPHTLTSEQNEGGSSRAEVVDILNEAYGRQIFNMITVVQSVDDLPLKYKIGYEKEDRNIRAVTYSNQIYMVADNLPLNRIVPVSIHELGVHGMQNVMGKRMYQQLMGQIAYLVNADPEIGAIYEAAKEVDKTGNEAIILEETMAYVVENEAMTNSPFWRSVVDAILYGLARFKLWLNPKLIGAREMLIFAKAAARRHANLAKDKDAVFAANFLGTFLYSGEMGNKNNRSQYEETMTSALREDVGERMMKGFDNNFFSRDFPRPTKWWENILMFRDVSKYPPVPGKRIRKLGGKKYQLYVAPTLQRILVDYFIEVRNLEAAIKERGGVVTAKNMPSLYHGAYKNIVNVKRRRFHEKFVEPLQNFMTEHKLSIRDLHLYLYAMHAPHRNRVKASAAKARKIPNASGIFTSIADAKKYQKENGLAVTPNSAEQIIKDLKRTLGEDKFQKLERASKFVYAINSYRLNLQLESGLLNFDRLDANQLKAYSDEAFVRTYVPLRGENVVIADEFFETPLGPGKIGVSGVESKKASGRVSEAENTVAWSVMETDYTIDRMEKNIVVLSFAKLIQDNKEALKDFATIVSLEDYKRHRDENNQLFLGLVEKQQTDPDHNIHFKANGSEFVILVKDKRIGQAFNRTNMTDSGVFLQTSSMINRYFSAVHTSFNPEFIITNFVRDFQTALVNVQGLKETVGEFKDTEKLSRNILRDIKASGIGLKRFIRDKKTDTEFSKLAEEFSLAGGRIDFYAFKDARDFEKKFSSYIKDTGPLGSRKWFKQTKDFISEYNAVVENTMRLSAYKNAKEAFIQNGMTEGDAIRRAAEISRNLTVNFSQKGELSSGLNALYLFFNASVQGSVRLLQATFHRPWNKTSLGKKGFTRVQKIEASIMTLGFAMGILNALLAGEDEDGINRYEKIDLKSRSRQMHIYMPGFDSFFKIPLPWGYNVFYVAGDTIAALMMGHTSPGRASMHMMSSTAEAFMPFSFGGSDNVFKAALKTASPTFTDPFVDLALNENYFGQPIYKDPVWGSSDPPSERYWSSTGGVFKGVSRSINALTGGSKVEPGFVSIPPDVLEHIWETVGGGAARFVERSTDLVWMIGPGRLTHRETGEVKWNKVPLARRFMYDETATANRFVYDKYSEYEKLITTAVGMEEGIREIYGKGGGRGILRKDYNNFKESDDYKLFKLNDYRRNIVGQITKLQKERNSILVNRMMRSDIKQDRIDRLNDRMRKLRVKLINKVDGAVFE